MEHEEYIRWLTDGLKIKITELIYLLFKKEYYYILEADKNRLMDGLKLREEYVCSVGDMEVASLPISVLEVLIALSKRISDDISGENDAAFWFNEMLKNLGLLNEKITVDGVSLALDVWLERRFASDGYGSPFPLKKPRKNMRTCELWYQANFYICENF